MNGRSRQLITIAGALAVLVGSASCGNVVRTGRSPSYLAIDSLLAASGAIPGSFGNTLQSDVVTIKTVNGQPISTIFNDLGRVTLHMLLKDAGTPAAPTSPSNLNTITITRYRVVFTRADGRITQGVDVPYAFDSAVTATVTAGPTTIGFELVRSQAKEEAPLVALARLGGRIQISTIANVTFYGQDQAGNEVTVTGSIGVDFADFGDPT